MGGKGGGPHQDGHARAGLDASPVWNGKEHGAVVGGDKLVYKAEAAARKAGLRALLRKAQFGTMQALALERQAQERIMKAVDDATKRQRLLMQRQESERRIMGREEERTRRHEELTRRVVENPHRDFQELGHRLYHHTVAHATYAPATVRRLQWVRPGRTRRSTTRSLRRRETPPTGRCASTGASSAATTRTCST